MAFLTCCLTYRLAFYKAPKYWVAFFRVAFIGWLISGRLFVGEAYFRVVYFRVAFCLDGIFPGGFFPGGFCRVAYFLDPPSTYLYCKEERMYTCSLYTFTPHISYKYGKNHQLANFSSMFLRLTVFFIAIVVRSLMFSNKINIII